jgi:hypothetical protein
MIRCAVQAEIEKRKRELAERRSDLFNARVEYERQVVTEFEYGSMIAEEKFVMNRVTIAVCV